MAAEIDCPEFQPDPPKQWTRITISDSEYGEVVVMVRRADLSLTDMIEDLLIPAMKAKGFSGVENWIFDHETQESG